MVPSLVWFLVLTVSAMAVAGAMDIASDHGTKRRRQSGRLKLATATASATTLIILAAVWRVHAVAVADGNIITELAKSRGTSLTEIMKIVTTIGDAVPCLLIASILALIVYRQHHHRFLVLIIPLSIIVELVIQIGMMKAFDDETVDQVVPQLVVGGGGAIPSGSVARLFALFLLTSHLWASSDRVGARRVATLGGALVIVELATRLYLARHLVADIAGGLLLGIFLERVGAAVIFYRRFTRSVKDPQLDDISNAGEQVLTREFRD